MNELKVDSSDIISDGHVCLYRQRADLPFTPDALQSIGAVFHTTSKLQSAFVSAMKEENELAITHPFAWNPEFGYITAFPDICGTGLEISAMFHLEGLHIIGDLEPVLNALSGLRMNVHGCNGDGLKNAAHIFRIANAQYLGLDEQDMVLRIRRVFDDIVRQESNARIRLVEEMPLLFEDSIARSLAILRSCRLISDIELLDMVSPLLIAADFDFLDNFSRNDAIELMTPRLNMPTAQYPETYEEQRERDRHDAALAVNVNKRFRNVRLNARSKDWIQ